MYYDQRFYNPAKVFDKSKTGLCKNGKKHILRNKDGENYCTICGEVFDTDMVSQHDSKSKTINSGGDQPSDPD